MGMAAALEESCAHIEENAARVSALRDRLIAGLSEIPHSVLNGGPDRRLPGNPPWVAPIFTFRWG